MKRSEINKHIENAIEFVNKHNLPLPEFAYWTEAEWCEKKGLAEEIIDNMLGWDVTDFGLGDYYSKGLLSFTFRNGNFHQKEKYPKPYAEKMLLVEEGQELPFHFHWYKMEDIINRGGGILAIQLYNANEDGSFKTDNVTVTIDGITQSIEAGDTVYLKPGQSITLLPYQYHRWVAKEAAILLFEVSTTNDDFTDNRFFDELPRIPTVVEDVEKTYLIFDDYKRLD